MRERADPDTVLRFAPIILLLCAACGAVEQPKSAKTVAAYEVPLPTASDKSRFLALLTEKAEAFGFHVDAATDDELKIMSERSEEHTSELQSLMRISYAVFCLKK